MRDLKDLLEQSAAFHTGTSTMRRLSRAKDVPVHNLCPRQVLGVRMGVYAGELFALDLPQSDKRLFAFVETDGCLIDGIMVATGCAVGHRTMRVIDYGKTAATFVDTLTPRAIRVRPHPKSRTRALEYALDADDRWHAQLAAYQIMPTEELLEAAEVELTISLAAIISQHGKRVVCDVCGEDIINEREVERGGWILCRACAGEVYYSATRHSFQTPVCLQ